MKLELLSLILPCLILSGCVAYESAPIDWEAEAAKLQKEPETVSLTIADASVRAVAFSPELNALRLAHATSKAKAAASGYWDDPSLDIDFLRVLKEPENPLTYGGSLSFTLPLSGIPGLEKRAAEAYSESDRWEIIAAESRARTAAAALVFKASTLDKTIKSLEHDRKGESYREARRVSTHLVEVGEMSRTELAHQAIAEQDLDQTLFELRNERREAEAKLRRLTGLPPNSTFDWSGIEETTTLSPNVPAFLDFTRAPQVKTALAKYEAKEIDLDKEIRRQYPEMSLGPAYTREDGFDKLGFTLGLTLPLWNRNRAGIAEAKGVREEARFAAISAWKDVVLEYAEGMRALEQMRDTSSTLSQDDSTHAAHREEVKRLYAAGELAAGEYVACLQQEWNWSVSKMRRHIAEMEAVLKVNGVIESLNHE